MGDIIPDYIAFANGPGLPGGLLVGRVAAETLANLFDRPIIGVNHLEGHLFACELTGTDKLNPLEFPLISLIVSGGHREVSKQALKGDKNAVKFPRPMLDGSCEFSFSGIKTAVSYYLRDHKDVSVPDICASFEQAVVETLVKKAINAAEKYKVKHIAVGGGVAANGLLREMLVKKAAEKGIEARFVLRPLSSDNAAMIALCAAKKLARGQNTGDIRINPNMVVRSWLKK